MQRNYSIDSLKILCALLVVFLHTNWAYQDYILPLTRCAVPCFFIISGFFLYNETGIGLERLKKNIINIVQIILWSTILFFIIKEFVQYYSLGMPYKPSKIDIVKCILFNVNPFGFHLWYLNAYLYVLIIICFVEKYFNWNLLFFFIPILLLGDLILGKYSLLLFDKEFPYIYVRNFLFVGIPYFSIGGLLKKNFVTIRKHLKQNSLMWFCLFFSFMSYIEKYTLLFLEKSPAREHYLSTTFLSIFLFLLFITIKQNKPNIISFLGEKYSLYVYILHPIFIMFYAYLSKRSIIINDIYSWIAPIIVFFSTLILSYIIKKGKFAVLSFYHKLT